MVAYYRHCGDDFPLYIILFFSWLLECSSLWVNASCPTLPVPADQTSPFHPLLVRYPAILLHVLIGPRRVCLSSCHSLPFRPSNLTSKRCCLPFTRPNSCFPYCTVLSTCTHANRPPCPSSSQPFCQRGLTLRTQGLKTGFYFSCNRYWLNGHFSHSNGKSENPKIWLKSQLIHKWKGCDNTH